MMKQQWKQAVAVIGITVLLSAMTVSYTHLDVYKRQGRGKDYKDYCYTGQPSIKGWFCEVVC